eukprot:1683808-Prymnesium_polylepis.1
MNSITASAACPRRQHEHRSHNSRTRKPRRWLTFRPVRGRGHKGELWASAKPEESERWMGWSGGRRGRRTGSPNPEGAVLS